MDKLKSRKLIMAVATFASVLLTDIAGVDIDPATYWSVVGVASSYILGQSIVDAKK